MYRIANHITAAIALALVLAFTAAFCLVCLDGDDDSAGVQSQSQERLYIKDGQITMVAAK